MPRTAAPSRARSIARAAAPLLLAVSLGACLLPPEPKTDAGQDVFNLYVIVLALAAIVFVGVEGFIVYAIVRYRRQPGDDALPEQHHGNTRVEIVWTVLPSILVAVLFAMSVITLGSVEARADQPGVTIRVESFQWQWRFIYPDGTVRSGTAAEPAELAVPVGEPVRLEMTSEDVNHAFFVPEFLIKRDLMQIGETGQPNVLEFVVTEAGTYAGQCAEFCGSGHAEMTFVVNAMPREEYDAYMAAVAAGESPPPPAVGECEETVEITADQTQFDIGEFAAPADTAFCIHFTNLEDVQHNVAIFNGDVALFQGEPLATAGEITYAVPPLPAGEYTFNCEFHPVDMVGDVRITE